MIPKRWAVALGAGLIGAWVAPSPVAACSCGGDFFEPVVYPRDGSTDVPPNTRLVWLTDRWSVSSTDPILRESDTGNEIEAVVESFRRVWSYRLIIVTPAQELTPHVAYELVWDEQDVGVVTSFTVGEEADREAPAAPESPSISAVVYVDESRCSSSCSEASPFRRIDLEFSEPARDALLLFAEIYLGTEAEPALRAPLAWDRQAGGARLTTSTCSQYQPPHFAVGDELCARLIAVDGAGNAAASDMVCTESISCSAGPNCNMLECIDPGWEPDAGADGPGSDGGSGAEGGGGSGRGCALAPGGAAGIWLMLALAPLLARRRRHGGSCT